MNRYARLQNGIVEELLTTDFNPEHLFNPSLQWVPVTTADINVGWSASADPITGITNFVPPEPVVPSLPNLLSLAQLQAEVTKLNSEISALTAIHNSGG